MRAIVLGPYTERPPQPLPFFLSLASCGFPSPADDYHDRPLDLNELVVKNPPATYFVRAQGDSMRGAGIFDGDVLVVDRSREPESGDVVIAALAGELTVKRVRVRSWKGGQPEALWLVPENDDFPLVAVTPEMDFAVWGVVTHVLHALTRESAREARMEARAAAPEARLPARGDGRVGAPPRLKD